MLVKMADELASYAEVEFPDDPELQVEVLRFELEASQHTDHDLEEQQTIATDIISAVNSLTDSGMPLSESLFDNLRFAHEMLASIAMERGDAAQAVGQYTECRKLLEGVKNNEWSLMKADVFIASAKAKMPGVDTASSLKDSLGLFKDFYEETKKHYGTVSQQALNAGDLLCGALMDLKQFIAYERVCADVLAISCQLHGVEHPYTEDLKWNLESIQKRCAVLLTEKDQPYEILEYDADADTYLLKRMVDEGENSGAIISVPASDLALCNGTPIVCHGLTDDEEHLNGVLGELKKSPDNHQYIIHFEDESLPSLQVKRENVSVVFELPSRE